jgi:hypothetical protein
MAEQEFAARNAEVETRFTYHSPTPEQVPKYQSIRDHAKELAYVISDLAPESREKALALTKLEEAVMWANAAVARRS